MAVMRKRQRGLTLIELMVTLAVAIVLLAAGIPLFSGMAANNRAAAQTNALTTALNVARSEAVRRGTTIALCTHASPLPVSSPACVTSDPDWRNGWFVFADEDADGVVDSGEQVLRVWEALSPNATVAATGNAWVSFDLAGAANGLHTFQLGHDDASANQPRCVTVTGAGNIRLARGACS